MRLITAILAAVVLLPGCMSQESATKQMTHEFVQELPNHPKTEMYDKIAKWVSNNSKTAGLVVEIHDREAGAIVSNGETEIQPPDSRVSMKIGFTLNVDVKNDRMRIRFTDLRRLFGSKLYDVDVRDDFFRSPTGRPYQRAAQAKFAVLVQSLTDFVGMRTADVATK